MGPNSTLTLRSQIKYGLTASTFLLCYQNDINIPEYHNTERPICKADDSSNLLITKQSRSAVP